VAFVPQQQTVEVVAAGPDRLDVRGALTFSTARTAYEAGCRFIGEGANGGRANGSAAGSSASTLQIDCAGVTESDSAGLAVLIEWLAAAGRIGRHLRYSNLPEGIRATAQISDVATFLDSGA
jgi:phospholipid transport system transporter-binding protein